MVRMHRIAGGRAGDQWPKTLMVKTLLLMRAERGAPIWLRAINSNVVVWIAATDAGKYIGTVTARMPRVGMELNQEVAEVVFVTADDPLKCADALGAAMEAGIAAQTGEAAKAAVRRLNKPDTIY